MNRFKDPELIRRYVNQFHLDDIFSFDLMQVAFITQYDIGETICTAGSYADNLKILVEGECHAFVANSRGGIHSELHYSGMNVLGLVGVLWEEPVINDIVTLTPCTFLDIPAEPNRERLLNDVKFLRFATRYLADHIRDNNNHSEPLPVRLAQLILQSEHDGLFQRNLIPCADLLETSYRHLLRTLQDFCEKGILVREKKGVYRIVSRKALTDMRENNSK